MNAATDSTPKLMRQGMACVDTSGNSRIPVLMELVGALSRAETPHEVLTTFANGSQKLDPTDGYIALSTRGLAPGEYRITRMVLDRDMSRFADMNPWTDLDRYEIHRGGFFSVIIRSAYPELILHLNISSDPVLGDALRPFGSMMVVPLFDQGEPLNWAIMLRRDPEGFKVKDLEDVILRANLVGGTVRQTLMSQQLRAANDKIRQEVQRIANIQRALLPQQMPDIPGLEMAASYQTFDEVGGDYYDFLKLPGCEDAATGQMTGERWGLLIADASGHGPAAAVMMAMLHAIFHAYPTFPCGPAEMLHHANEHLHAKRIESSFVTAFFAIFDPQTRRLSYARAGHVPPLLKSPGAGGAVRWLRDVGSVPLGVLDEAEYEDASVILEPGQSLVMFTDGISEAMNPSSEMFGMERIAEAVTRCTGMPECVVDTLTSALLDHEGQRRPADDQTLVVAQLTP